MPMLKQGTERIKKVRTKNEKEIEVQKMATEAAREAKRAFLTADDLRECVDAYFRYVDEECDGFAEESAMLVYLSDHNKTKKVVTYAAFNSWCNGDNCPDLQEEANRACMILRAKREKNPIFQTGNGATRLMFDAKQKRFGGYKDREEKTEQKIVVEMGDGFKDGVFR